MLFSRLVKNFNSARTLVILAAAATLSVATAHAKDSVDGSAIAERIAPVSSVCMSGDDCAAAPVAAAPAAPRSGEEVYKSKCTTCHSIGVSGAPKFGNKDDWAPRIAKGMDTLFTHAWNGINAMPAKGLCTDCSEDEIKGAIAYMVDNSQ